MIGNIPLWLGNLLTEIKMYKRSIKGRTVQVLVKATFICVELLDRYKGTFLIVLL